MNNLYGHPNGGVLERLADANAGIYRTDQQGEIQLRVGKEGIIVRHKLTPAPD
ncbi:hypothetical protein ACFTAO_35835 [Paenibacillus rhizoplanae]